MHSKTIFDLRKIKKQCWGTAILLQDYRISPPVSGASLNPRLMGARALSKNKERRVTNVHELGQMLVRDRQVSNPSKSNYMEAGQL